MRITGRRAPTTSTSDICSSTLSVLVMRDGRAIDEALGAIAGLQDELPPFGGFGELFAQAQDFPTGDQRRQRTQIGQYPFEFGRVCVFGLL